MVCIASRSADPETDNAKNVLKAIVRSDSLFFHVNGETVASFVKPPYFDTSGAVGLRVDGGVDVHFSRLDVTPAAAID